MAHNSGKNEPKSPLYRQFHASPPPVSRKFKGQIFSQRSNIFDFYTHKNILYAETSKNINTSFAVYIICIEGGQKPAVKSERRILDELLWRMRQQRSFDTCHHHNPALCGR